MPQLSNVTQVSDLCPGQAGGLRYGTQRNAAETISPRFSLLTGE